MDPITTTLLTTAASSLASALVATLVSRAKSGVKEMEASSEAVKAGMRALLWRELQIIHEHAMEQGGLTVSERRHLESVYAAYHGLGGNGTGTRLYNDAMNQPVLD